MPGMVLARAHLVACYFCLTRMNNPVSRERLVDISGFVILAMLMALIPIFIPIARLLNIVWIPIYLLVALCVRAAWYHPKAPKRPSQWFLYALYSLGFAIVFFMISRGLAYLVFGDKESELSRVFDYAIVFALAPGGTVIAILGGARLCLLAPR
jgi:hypothetical protein